MSTVDPIEQTAKVPSTDLPRTMLAAAVVLAAGFTLLTALGFPARAIAQTINLPPMVPPLEVVIPPDGYPATVAPTAPGPFYAQQAWSQTLAPNVRFVVLSNFNNDAVLDRETGLVWARQTLRQRFSDSIEVDFRDAPRVCKYQIIGGRGGWRLPSVAELQSLVDYSLPENTAVPSLPPGHPFKLHPAVPNFYAYWADEEYFSITELRWGVIFNTQSTGAYNGHAAVLCVRGPR